ncbi:hypothetical protein P170DRAFT_401977 [Aspergillus steynii IBT 23096]|uniref:BZIP domain-containing protein n=1 Tax=Aspergillus steynii IBT 23096 TaxID=1392250 RepID=A0A2I2GH00_9EURO|nr:uncharacterized protein P170DRAFT_401977 [Aspergillus steynii IBT 23096]PLB52107.1 hypothetical protein P170DRAFT_401977 [Aspergillus steynii IBT 23096]
MSTNTEPVWDSSVIRLEHMPPQAKIWQSSDDWTGVIDRKQRRKLQNRQNQRAYRRRRKHDEPDLPSQIPSSAVMLVQSFDLPTPQPSPQSIQDPHPDAEYNNDQIQCHHAPRHALSMRRTFNAILQQAYMDRSPRLEHLIGLSRLNVHRAINENITALGMTPSWMISDAAISIFNVLQPGPWGHDHEHTIPDSLRPTEVQRTVPHHPWLDFFPFPNMRDRLILAQDVIDEDDLCHDLMAFWDTRNTQATLLVWGQPWEPRNWEVTEGFARKWGWLLLGSPEALVASDSWRRRRGERGLAWREILGVSTTTSTSTST